VTPPFTGRCVAAAGTKKQAALKLLLCFQNTPLFAESSSFPTLFPLSLSVSQQRWQKEVSQEGYATSPATFSRHRCREQKLWSKKALPNVFRKKKRLKAVEEGKRREKVQYPQKPLSLFLSFFPDLLFSRATFSLPSLWCRRTTGPVVVVLVATFPQRALQALCARRQDRRGRNINRCVRTRSHVPSSDRKPMRTYVCVCESGRL